MHIQNNGIKILIHYDTYSLQKVDLGKTATAVAAE